MKQIKLIWSKREKDWKFYYPDNSGRALRGVFFDMVKTTGHRTDWQKELAEMLRSHGYDPSTLKITCKRINPPTATDTVKE
jgi:hypothetical protein